MFLEHWVKGQGDNSPLARFGDIPLPQPPEKTGDLAGEWRRQANKLATLFAKELGMTTEEYLASLPEFTPQPEQFKGRFDVPIIVETRVPLAQLCKLAGIETGFNISQIMDWNDPRGYQTPTAPYVAWVQDGTKYLRKSVMVVREELAGDERGATVVDGIALITAHPEILREHFVGLPGSRVGSGNAPDLSLWLGRPKLYCDWVGSAYRGYGSVSCGRV